MVKNSSRKTTTKKRRGVARQQAMEAAPGVGPWAFTRAFTPDVLETTVIAVPLLDLLSEEGTDRLYDIIIDVNLDFPGGAGNAQQRIKDFIRELVRAHGLDPGHQGVHDRKTDMTKQYLFGRLRGDLIQELVRKDRELARAEERRPAIHLVWPDFQVASLTSRSIATIKADTAREAFGASGDGIVWVVMDSGIDARHPHFQKHRNLVLDPPLRHCDFTTFGELDEEQSERTALTDENGHGTYVAGIIAGEIGAGDRVEIKATVNKKDERGMVVLEERSIETISGMAPACKLISFKVLDEFGKGLVSNLIAACAQIREVNSSGPEIRIHGVNMSVGYDFEPRWFTSGQSPLCVEVDRLVHSGVVVVVAAGNTGYGWQWAFRGAVASGMEMTINDPGNAALAITVGSTHRENPLVYGVSYFSSKGPTGDGRFKPDLVAPGEKIISCERSGHSGDDVAGSVSAARSLVIARYREDSGTSVAAAHMSGSVAAFLSVCPEFIGRPEETKEIFLSNATDLKRASTFQGRGLVDLFRALSYVRRVSGRTSPLAEAAPEWEGAGAVRLAGEGAQSGAVEVFISYSHADERLRMQLGMHLALLKRQGVIDEWHDRRISAGQEWVGEVDKHLNSATIILLLVSATFLASDYCYDVEMKRALARHDAGEAVVIPVILRHVDWKKNAPFAHLQALPKDGKPVEAWSLRARAFADIADGIRKVAEELGSARHLAGSDGNTVRLDAAR